MQRVRGLLALALALACCAAPGALAQVRGPSPKAHARKSDVPYIKCQVCELLAKNAFHQAAAQLKRPPSGARGADEVAMIERMEKIATAWREEGHWITKLDLVEKGSRLVVKEMGDKLGDCGVECKTIERAAEEVLGEHDADVGEALFNNKRTLPQFTAWLCTELTGACKAKPPPLPKDRAPGPAWQAADPEEANLEKMMGEMNDQGLRGQVYSREELLKKYAMEDPAAAGGKGGAAGHDDDDDEGEEGEGRAAGSAGGAGEGREAGGKEGSAEEAIESARRAWAGMGSGGDGEL